MTQIAPAPGQIWQNGRNVRFRVLAISESDGRVFVDCDRYSRVCIAENFTGDRATLTYLPDATSLDPADDWVDLPADHVIRQGVDFIVKGGERSYLVPADLSVGVKALYSPLGARCRRRDLPVPPPQPPVAAPSPLQPGTVWRDNQTGWYVVIVGNDEDGDPEYLQISVNRYDVDIMADFLSDHTRVADIRSHKWPPVTIPVTVPVSLAPISGHSSVSIDSSGRVSS